MGQPGHGGLDVSRGAGTLNLYAATDTNTWREWSVTANKRAADLTPGEAFTLTVLEQWFGTETLAPARPNAVTVTLKNGAGGVVRQFSLDVALTSWTLNLALTTDGLPGSPAAAGTLEIDIRATRTSIGTYDASSDARGTQAAPGNVLRDRWWQRAPTTVVRTLGRGSTMAAFPGALGQFRDQVWIAATFGHPVYRPPTDPTIYTVRVDNGAQYGNGAGLPHSTTTATPSPVSLYTLDNARPAARVPVRTIMSVPTHPASGQAYVQTTDTESVVDMDPRLTVIPLVQHNDKVFGTPPLSKHRSMRRLTSDLTFLGARVVGSRGDGMNDVQLTRQLYDRDQLVAGPASGVKTHTAITATVNGEDGWVPSFMVWDASGNLPLGPWLVRNTSSTAGVNGLLTPLDTEYTLGAPDPNLVCVVGGGPGTPTSDSRHFVPGEPFVIAMAVFDKRTRTMRPVDAGTARVLAARLSLSTGQAEILQADGVTWLAGHIDGNAAYHDVAETFPGSRVYSRVLGSDLTATWTTSDVILLGEAEVNGVPVTNFHKEVTVGGINNHTAYKVDPFSVVGLGTR